MKRRRVKHSIGKFWGWIQTSILILSLPAFPMLLKLTQTDSQLTDKIMIEENGMMSIQSPKMPNREIANAVKTLENQNVKVKQVGEKELQKEEALLIESVGDKLD